MKRKMAIVILVLLFILGAVAGFSYLKQYAGNRLHVLVKNAVRDALYDDRYDIRRRMFSIACEESAHFVLENMSNCPAFPDRYALLDHSLASVDPRLNGLYCEFGVYTGISVNFIASGTDQTIHGFDSFKGNPETWRADIPKGMFEVSELPKVRHNVQLHTGWFEDSLPIWAEEFPGPIAFMHLDADLYSSTKTVFDILGDRIVPGTVIQFDEYFNYPGWQTKGEYKAFQEFCEARQIKFEYLGYCDQHEQLAVRIVSVGALAPN
jgi:hypothetical protein